LDEDAGAATGGQHHQAHDRGAGHRLAVAGNPDAGVKRFRALHEPGRSAGMEAPAVLDHQSARRSVGHDAGRTSTVGNQLSSPASTRLATLMYFRPAS